MKGIILFLTNLVASGGVGPNNYEQFISVRGDTGIPFKIVCTNDVGTKLEFSGISPADKVFVNRRPPKNCIASRDTAKPGTIQFTIQVTINGSDQRVLKDSAIKPVKLTREKAVQMVSMNPIVVDDGGRELSVPNRFSGRPDTQTLDRVKDRYKEANQHR